MEKQYKDNSIIMIALSIVFCVCSIGIDILYWKNYPAFYLACTVIASIALVVCAVCLVFRLIKRDREEKYNKRLLLISMVFAAASLTIMCIGTLILMFI